MAFLNIAPTGTVLPFAGSTAPEGWAICNGAAINRTTYATLFSVISTTYGTGDGSITFNLPDMQGVFPRGSGTNGTGNYGGATGHTPAGGSPGNKGRQYTRTNGITVSGGSASGTFASSSHSHEYSHFHEVPIGYDGVNFWWGNATVGNTVVNDNNYRVSSSTLANPGFRRNQMPTNYLNTTTTGGNSANGSVSSTASSLNAGDAETTPAFLALNYIIKL